MFHCCSSFFRYLLSVNDDKYIKCSGLNKGMIFLLNVCWSVTKQQSTTAQSGFLTGVYVGVVSLLCKKVWDQKCVENAVTRWHCKVLLDSKKDQTSKIWTHSLTFFWLITCACISRLTFPHLHHLSRSPSLYLFTSIDRWGIKTVALFQNKPVSAGLPKPRLAGPNSVKDRWSFLWNLKKSRTVWSAGCVVFDKIVFVLLTGNGLWVIWSTNLVSWLPCSKCITLEREQVSLLAGNLIRSL